MVQELLAREANDRKDVTGGDNQYTTLGKFVDSVGRILNINTITKKPLKKINELKQGTI